MFHNIFINIRGLRRIGSPFFRRLPQIISPEYTSYTYFYYYYSYVEDDSD